MSKTPIPENTEVLSFLKPYYDKSKIYTETVLGTIDGKFSGRPWGMKAPQQHRSMTNGKKAMTRVPSIEWPFDSC